MKREKSIWFKTLSEILTDLKDDWNNRAAPPSEFRKAGEVGFSGGEQYTVGHRSGPTDQSAAYPADGRVYERLSGFPGRRSIERKFVDTVPSGTPGQKPGRFFEKS